MRQVILRISKKEFVSLEDVFVCQSEFISGSITESKIKIKIIEDKKAVVRNQDVSPRKYVSPEDSDSLL